MDAASKQAHRDQRAPVEPEAALGNEGADSPQLAAHGDTRLRNAQARTAALEATLADLTARRATVLSEFAAVPSVAERLPRHAGATAANSSAERDPAVADDAAVRAAKAIIQERIRRLNEYNEIRDIGQGLMGIIAESRGVRIKEVQEEFDISAKD
ncbi:putative DNA repair protein swi5 protein [Neofusicoccum parvum]|uniref:DNA repair protein swi5 protein n=1 Tax=Neofusicoccum parvum TaxID=310453 RepID=A0ACB5SGF2_9PEZI|nr:putative DNA repair protein swi5 protein [Neofusicoccum parvum]